MCLICTELIKERLSSIEARKNLGEMRYGLEKDHILEVLQLIWKKEDEEKEEEFEQIFHEPAD